MICAEDAQGHQNNVMCRDCASLRRGAPAQFFRIRTVSECCSGCVWGSEGVGSKGVRLGRLCSSSESLDSKKSLRWLPCWLGSQVGVHRKNWHFDSFQLHMKPHLDTSGSQKKNLMPVISPPAILGPAMAAPTLGACAMTTKFLDLETRGPRIDPFRASGPKWGRKWPKNGYWPHLKNGGSMARKMGKMARNSIFEPFWAHFFHFPGQFSHFPGRFRPICQVRPKSIFSAIFVPISGRRPEMDLYEVHGIPSLDNQICTFKNFIVMAFPTKKQRFWTIFLSAPSRSASGGCLQGGASFEGEKAHFAA